MKTLIIAEAGVNHNGNLQIAKKLIIEAAKAGADYVKFQVFIAELNIVETAEKAVYQKKNTSDSSETQLEMVRKLELSFEQFEQLQQICRNNHIGFLATGFDHPSIDFLAELNIPFFKIPSGEITNKPYLQHIAKKGKPLIVSTGMANMEEIKKVLDVFTEEGISKNDITVLHCNTEYPTPMRDVNLKAMNTIKENLGVTIGYSDHTLGIEVSIAAVALGAKVIEKHFTLDRNMDGPDHRASLEPGELKTMIEAIRNVELAISGSGIKEPSPSEQKNINIARKSIVAAKKITKGEVFTDENLTVKRPGKGMSPMKWNEILGKVAKRSFEKDELIEI